MKCDLGRPSCARCVKAGRACEGYQLSVIEGIRALRSSEATPPRLSGPSLLLSAFRATQSEWQAYGFYNQKIASTLGGAFDTELWQKMVVQVADTDTTVRNGIFALGNLFRHGDGVPNPASYCVCTHCRQALRYYNKSISSFSRYLQQPPAEQTADVALLSCIIFICLEFYRMNDSTGISLISQGCSMIAETIQAGPSSRAAATDPRLVKLFDRLWLLSSMFGYNLRPPTLGFTQIFPPHQLPEFENIEAARDSLNEIMKLSQGLRLRIYQAHRDWTTAAGLSTTIVALQMEQEVVLSWLDDWHSNLQGLVALQALRSFRKSQAWSLLIVQYLISKIIVRGSMDPIEKDQEDRSEEFEELVIAAEEGLARAPPEGEVKSFSFEVCFLPPLYLAAVKCLNPVVRRKALELMCLTRAKEGLWQRSELITVAARVMEIEEGLAVLPGEDPDGQNPVMPLRFYDVVAGLNYRMAEKTFVDVTYLIYDAFSEQHWRSVRETLLVDE